MNSKLCVIALIAIAALATPVAAQDGRAGIWAPWTADDVQPVPQTQLAPPAQPRVQRVQVAQTVTPAVPEQKPLVQRFLNSTFWVIGSFR